MKARHEIVRELIERLLAGTWSMLVGPRGIGKRHIVSEVLRTIQQKKAQSHYAVLISFAGTKESTVRSLHQLMLTEVANALGKELPRDADFDISMRMLLQDSNKPLILLLTDVDILSPEAAALVASSLSSLDDLSISSFGPRLTVLLCGGQRLTNMTFPNSSPFTHTLPIDIDELDFRVEDLCEENERRMLPGLWTDTLHHLTRGAPELFQTLLPTLLALRDKYAQLSQAELTEKIVEGVFEVHSTSPLDEREVVNPVIHSWLSHIDNPEFLDTVLALQDREKVDMRTTKLSKERVALSGFLVHKDGVVQYRNELVRLFMNKYVTKKRIADHYWLFSPLRAYCWNAGRTLYNSLSTSQRQRNTREVIGPVHRSLSDVLIMAALHMLHGASEKEVFATMDDILHYLFSVDQYYVAEGWPRQDQFWIAYAPERSRFIHGSPIDDAEQSALIARAIADRGPWSHCWRYSYVAFPVSLDMHRKLVLWIDNQEGHIPQGNNALVMTLASYTGRALLELQRKEHVKTEAFSRAVTEKAMITGGHLQLQYNWIRNVMALSDNLWHTCQSTIGKDATRAYESSFVRLCQEAKYLMRSNRRVRDVVHSCTYLAETSPVFVDIPLIELFWGLDLVAIFNDDRMATIKVHVDPEYVSEALRLLMVIAGARDRSDSGTPMPVSILDISSVNVRFRINSIDVQGASAQALEKGIRKWDDPKMHVSHQMILAVQMAQQFMNRSGGSLLVALDDDQRAVFDVELAVASAGSLK